jgi:drug/metabolite transporter (DMT)-like permease
VPDSSSAGDSATPLPAILCVFGAGLAFACLDASAKYLVLSGVQASFVTWSRFAVHVILVFLLFRGWTGGGMYRFASLPRQVLRGIFLFGSTVFNFFALDTLQLAETISIFFFSPMLITALAGPFLGEWAGWRRWVAVILGFVGVLVITRPGIGAFGIGHVYALAAMVSYSFYVIMTRAMSAAETPESLIFYSALTPVVLMAPVVPLHGTTDLGALQLLLLLSLGFYGAFGHWLLIRAYKIATTSALAPYPYLQMVWMIGFGFLVFDQLPDRWTIAGAAIIVASGLYIVHRERRLRLASLTTPASDARELAKKL